MPAMSFKKVVFPQPEGPMIAPKCGAGYFADTLFRSVVEPWSVVIEMEASMISSMVRLLRGGLGTDSGRLCPHSRQNKRVLSFSVLQEVQIFMLWE